MDVGFDEVKAIRRPKRRLKTRLQRLLLIGPLRMIGPEQDVGNSADFKEGAKIARGVFAR